MIENGTVLQDRYVIDRKIGSGGMGAVYLAIDKRFDNHVAIKETFYKEEEFGDAFEREARLLNALQHPVLPHVSDYFAEDGNYFIVMQFIEGEDLSDVLKRDGAFPVKDVLRWSEQLLDALDYLHSQDPPVIHRDIKPHNLKLNQRGGIMLLDFGLAKLNKKDATEVSVFGYSRTYSPLEQIQGTGTDARSDIFALGATVYHLLTGSPPLNALMRAASIIGGNPDPLKLINELRPEIPDSVASVVNTALALNAENRFASAKAMHQALEHATHQETGRDAPKKASLAAVAASPALTSAAQNVSLTASETAFDAKPSNAAELPPMVEKLPVAGAVVSEKITPPNSARPSPFVVALPPEAPIEKEVSHRRILWAAAAILLFFGIGAAFYFGGGESPNEQTGTQAGRANTATRSTNRENLAETRKKPAEKSKPDSDESKSDPEAAKVSEPENQPVESAPAKRKNAASKNDERVSQEGLPTEPQDDSEPADEETDVEPTERPSRQEKPIPDMMTEQEFEQIKSREKQKRRANRNQPESENQ